jgi:hypothetical protein
MATTAMRSRRFFVVAVYCAAISLRAWVNALGRHQCADFIRAGDP